jgi:hypothetical protein
MEKVIEIKPLDNFEIWVLFADNYSAKINIKPFITSGISLKLLDTDFFQKVRIDEFGGIVWENGFDFCPNYLRELTDKQLS